MADSDNQRATALERSDVPKLVDSYRTQREALRSHTLDLVRLRTDIRATAEREARDIVESTRRDVRRILVNARRELLVLAAQVHAATEDTPAAEASESRSDRLLAEAAQAGLMLDDDAELVAARDALVSARQHVHAILENARPDIDALGAALQGLGMDLEVVEESPAHRPEPPIDRRSGAEDAVPPIAEPHAPTWMEPQPIGGTARPARVFWIAFAASSLVLVLGAGSWFWYSRSSGPAQPVRTTVPSPPIPSSSAPAVPSTPSTADAPSEVVSAPAPSSPSLSIAMEAREEVWVQTIIDGNPDAGRLFRPGETRQISGATDISIRAGNAGALYVSRDGGPFEPLGRGGQILTRRFGIEPPAGSTGAP